MDQRKIDQELKNPPASLGDRKDFLIAMYNQMWNNINTHILVVWQSIGALIASFAIFTLIEKQIVSIDIATTLIILVSAWLLAHVYDSSAWYNRNQTIIANIEKLFLTEGDLKLIHYYFAKHRKDKSMILHLRIQYMLGMVNILIFTVYHFNTKVRPVLGDICGNIVKDTSITLPYFVLIAAIAFLIYTRHKTHYEFNQLKQNSPGKRISDSVLNDYGIKFGK